MKIIVIGASGTIGAAVATALEQKHEVVRASRKGNVKVDIEDATSIRALFTSVKGVDAVVCCAGDGKFMPLSQLTDEHFAFSLKSKLMGQVNVARIALAHVKDGGSVTLTSGVLGKRPMPGGAAFSLVNGGVEAFVRAAALEAERKIRVNVVSPGWVTETMKALKMDSSTGMPAADVARAYVAVVEGAMSGETVEPKP